MDSTRFDTQAKQHLGIYKGFLTLMVASTIAVAIVLILMAIFLL